MAVLRADVRNEAKALAQNLTPSGPTGIQLLLNDPADYNEAIDLALRFLDADRPNLRIKDHTVTVASFLFTLFGAGAILPADPATDLDAWVDGASSLRDVWHPYSDADQGVDPVDRNNWRTRRAPGPKVLLEFLDRTPAVGDVLRLEYLSPHRLHESTGSLSSVLDGDQQAIVTVSGAMILQLAANKAVQNTGNSNLPNDIVDRRSQADQFRSLAKDLLTSYGQLVGKGSKDNLQGASAVRDMDVSASHLRGMLWHPPGIR